MNGRWSKLVDRLTGRGPRPEPPDAPEPSGPEMGLTPPVAEATPAAADSEPAVAIDPAANQTPPVAAATADTADEAVMQNADTQHANPEPSPRQALSAYNAQDDVQSVSANRHSEYAGVARIYARALVEMADEQGRLDEVTAEVEDLTSLLRAQPELDRLLSTPAIGQADRKGVIDRVFRSRVSATVYRFLQVVNSKDRTAALPAIFNAYRALIAERQGIVDVDVYVAQRLSPDEADGVAGRIGEAIGKRVVLHQSVDPSLIGGLTIRVGDQLIDGSVATQLRNMRKQLIEAGREKARHTTAIQE